MNDSVRLRDYQEECIADFMRRVDLGDFRIPSVLATGLGKTVIFSALAKLWLAKNANKRVLVLAHTDELVLQAAGKMHDAAPHLRVGIVKAEMNQPTADVVIASVQTLRNERRRNQIRNVGLIIVDECHHSVAKTYRDILTHYGAFDNPGNGSAENLLAPVGVPRVIVAGFTATRSGFGAAT